MRADSRLVFYPVVEVDGVPECDVLSGYFYRFRMRNAPTYHRVSADEIHRFDLIAWRAYGNVNLWWFILKVNDIVDPYSLEEGQVLTIPAISDYWAFYAEVVA